MSLMNSSFCWLLIRPVLTYGLVATVFSSQFPVLGRFQTDWVYGAWSVFWGHKMSETRWGLNTTTFGRLLKYTFFITAAMVTAV
jgi:hypothetical protein